EEKLIPEFKANLSEEQYDLLSNVKNIVGNLFPNLSFLISHTEIKGKPISNSSIRMWNPISHNKMEVITWFFVEKNASESWKERSKESFVLTFSPSGIFEQDDTEVFTDITASGSGLIPQQMGMHHSLKMGLNRKPI